MGYALTKSGGGDSDGNGYLDTNDAEDADNWVTPAGVDDNVAYQRGTVFGSNFLIPFAKTADKRTMQLQLVATVELPGASEGDAAIVAANAVVRAWNINLPQVVFEDKVKYFPWNDTFNYGKLCRRVLSRISKNNTYFIIAGSINGGIGHKYLSLLYSVTYALLLRRRFFSSASSPP